MITVEGSRVTADTSTVGAVFDNGVLTSLKRKGDGRELVKCRGETPPLELVYARGETVPLGGADRDTVTCRPLNDHRAEYRFEAWHGDGVLTISEDRATGDILLEPGAYSSRRGVVGVRYTVGGIDTGLKLVAPFFQGVRLSLDDPIIAGKHFRWPHYWEAGLAILDGPDGGFWVHCRDDRYRYKALHVGGAAGPLSLAFQAEAYGPLHENLSAGGIVWRLNAYEGDWKVPAAAYRDWLFNAYGLDGASRPDWLRDLRFAVSWCPCDGAILDALAARLDPKTVLLHVPHWRSDPYDENYPTYEASAEGREFIRRAQKMGFRTMPHMNAIDMDPTHPAYTYLRDFQYRALEMGRVEGWVWTKEAVRSVPESNAARLRHRDKKTMVKIHPGLSMWRSILAENVRKAVDDLGLEVVFLDVTLNTWNLHNALVENTTPTEGMKKLIAEVAALNGGILVGGEGRNEIMMQDEGLAQVHLFESWRDSIDGLERAADCPLNEFLFGGLCRSFGYSRLSGRDDDEALRMRVHVSLGAIPTVTISDAGEIAEPNGAVAEMLKLSGG
ncbi:MAG: DUF6259 domain-containing protein [Planctomycetota bacterium]|jgi:hypothetical protein